VSELSRLGLVAGATSEARQNASDALSVLPDAIDRAALVVLCATSPEYLANRFTRMEAAYAFRQGKPVVVVSSDAPAAPGWVAELVAAHAADAAYARRGCAVAVVPSAAHVGDAVRRALSAAVDRP